MTFLFYVRMGLVTIEMHFFLLPEFCRSTKNLRPWNSNTSWLRLTQVTKVKVKATQPCPTFCNTMDYTVHGILLTRILEWVAFPSPRDLPSPGIESRSPALPAEPQRKPKWLSQGPKFALLENPLFCFKYLVSMVLLLYHRAFWVCY